MARRSKGLSATSSAPAAASSSSSGMRTVRMSSDEAGGHVCWRPVPYNPLIWLKYGPSHVSQV